MGYINTTPSKTAFDVLDVSLLSKINLINLFASYRGKPRLFEIEAIAGMGWLHYYVNGKGDDNSWSTRLGLNLNFNLGETKAWTLGIKPAIVYDMQGDFNQAKSRFNANNATFELTAGLTYHFKMSTGNHYFTKVKVYNQSEIDDLNVAINALREQVGSRDRELNNANQRISGLHKELEECRTKVVPIETVVKTARVPESIITFRQGRSSVDASQLPNVERVASYMKKYPDSKVIIKGYASPEGNVEINAKIATARAEAVKTILVNKYKINTSRITAEDQGVGDMFTEPAPAHPHDGLVCRSQAGLSDRKRHRADALPAVQRYLPGRAVVPLSREGSVLSAGARRGNGGHGPSHPGDEVRPLRQSCHRRADGNAGRNVI